MADNEQRAKKPISADWFLRGALVRVGDTFDRFTGRRWNPSSSLATSELIERMKRLLDSEAKEVAGKGRVVPHNIKLKMQWDKFSTDSEETLLSLENELLTAAADHINDSLYYTLAPLHVEVKPDYFTEGVKLYVGYDKFSDNEPEAELNVTITGIQIGPGADTLGESNAIDIGPAFVAKYEQKGYPREKFLEFGQGRRFSVGRSAANDIALNDPSVSKIHASLAFNDGKLIIADTGSTNGTFINGERIAYGKAMPLDERDIVKFGDVEMRFSRREVPVTESGNDRPITESHKTTIAIEGLDLSGRPESNHPAVPISDINIDETGGLPQNSDALNDPLQVGSLDPVSKDTGDVDGSEL